MSDPIRRRIVLTLLVDPGNPVPVKVDFYWNPTDPHAVIAQFITGPRGDCVEWVFSRELLLEGARSAVGAGQGDVQVRQEAADPSLVRLSLASPSGRAEFNVNTGSLLKFLGDTLLVVQIGEEYADHDVDAELAQLLTDAA